MKRSTLLAALTVAGATLVGSIAEGDRKKGGGDYRPLGDDASWTTVHTNTLGLEGLTADAKGNLYSPARNSAGDCPVVRVPASGGDAVTVGTIPAPCSPAGLAFDKRGDLFVANAPNIYRLRPSASNPPVATVFATDVPGANGVAFDERGALWVSDGGQGQGRVWRIGVRRPTRGDVPRAADGQRRRRRPRCALAARSGSQAIVANGLAFDRDGSLFIADTARGAIWRAELGRHGQVRSAVGCDTTFASNTLCLSNVFVQHPALEGADGIALDRAGNVVTAVNERNAVVVATQRSGVVELFRNPVSSARPAQRGPARVPDEPGDRGQEAVPGEFGRVAARQLPQHRRRGDAGRAGPREAVLPRDRLPVEGLPLPVR